MRRLPIRLRVTLAFAGAMAILLIALGLFIYLRFRSQLDATIDQGLRSRAEDVSTLVGGSPRHPRAVGLPSGESFAQVLSPSGQILDSSPRLTHSALLSPQELDAASTRALFIDRDRVPGLTNDPVRLFAQHARAVGNSRVVVVGDAIDDRGDALNSLRKVLLIGGPIALLLASLTGYAAAAGALRPVEAMRRRAAAISAADPDERLPVPDTGDEIARLGRTLNEMLARLEAALERERTFVDDASHELRTPLAMHRAELELALRYGKGTDELRAAIASAMEEADRLGQLAEDLLVVARSDKGRLALDLRPTPIDELLEGVRERFAARSAESGRSLTVDAPDGLRIDADRVRLEQALSNLVDNALRHGEGDVALAARPVDGTIELHVEDQGRGFPPQFLASAFERFTRAETGRTGGGTGLGLAIVDAIARAHRGHARAVNRPEGGADVWLELPA